MDIGVAEARQRFRELLDRATNGETVRITRRNSVVALITPPASETSQRSMAEAYQAWRATWDVDSWLDDDLFAGVRDTSAGRPPPW